jgi:predicted DNA-binding antitoxin AbrB/MazE fold protein
VWWEGLKDAPQANVITIAAKYENGIFRPLEDAAIQEGTLVEVYVPAGSETAGKRRSIKELPFYGMWADRDDIIDGVSYVNTLRNSPRG